MDMHELHLLTALTLRTTCQMQCGANRGFFGPEYTRATPRYSQYPAVRGQSGLTSLRELSFTQCALNEHQVHDLTQLFELVASTSSQCLQCLRMDGLKFPSSMTAHVAAGLAMLTGLTHLIMSTPHRCDRHCNQERSLSYLHQPECVLALQHLTRLETLHLHVGEVQKIAGQLWRKL